MNGVPRRRDETEGRRASRIDFQEGGRYLGIPLGALRDPHHQHPWYPRACSADTGRNPSSVSHNPLTTVSTKPGQVHYAARHQQAPTPACRGACCHRSLSDSAFSCRSRSQSA